MKDYNFFSNPSNFEMKDNYSSLKDYSSLIDYSDLGNKNRMYKSLKPVSGDIGYSE